MARPSKPVSVIQMEKKSHRTKKELASRKRAEDQMLAGDKIRKFPEVRENRKASMEWDRITEILDRIDKNDRTYETVINRYCLMLAECRDMEKLKKTIEKTIKDLIKAFKEQVLAEVSPTEKAELLINFTEQIYKMSATLIKYDREIEKKRAMLLAIEKESGMTLAAMLRTIPKEPEKAANPLLEALNSG